MRSPPSASPLAVWAKQKHERLAVMQICCMVVAIVRALHAIVAAASVIVFVIVVAANIGLTIVPVVCLLVLGNDQQSPACARESARYTCSLLCASRTGGGIASFLGSARALLVYSSHARCPELRSSRWWLSASARGFEGPVFLRHVVAERDIPCTLSVLVCEGGGACGASHVAFGTSCLRAY